MGPLGRKLLTEISLGSTRRLVVLTGGVVSCGAVFWLYALIFGRIDGLPPIPEAFLARRSADDIEPLPEIRSSVIDKKLQRAFGPTCVETAYNHRIELQKNGVILATNQVTIEPDGRCKLKPLSIAVVKDRGPAADPEVYTIHSDEAFIVFDKPVKNLAEMGQRKIVGCELSSDPGLLSPDPRRHRITCQHNRGTADPEDDLLVETVGPVVYRELPHPEPAPDVAPPQIQTTAAVRLVDKRGQPRSTTITAQGMKIYLAQAKDPGPGKSAGKASSPNGVRQVVLTQQVTMDLWIDPSSGFLATGARPAANAPPAERSNVQITTPGPFIYRVGEAGVDTARFEYKPAAQPGDRPGFVQVVRPMIKDRATVYDQIDCDFLELSFANKPAGSGANGEPGSSLQSIHAWGQYVVVTSQGENLQAHGNDLAHDAQSKQTTLRGVPEVVALKDGHEIHAPAIVLLGADGKQGAEAYALGAGWFKAQPGQGQGADRPLTARWQDRMHYRKEANTELITLSGAAVVEDPERKQTLSGEQIKLTLAAAPQPTGAAPGQARVRPRRLEVTGRVAARSPELVVQDTDQLVLLFTDAPPKLAVPVAPAAGAPAAGAAPTAPTPADARPGAAPPARPPLALSARSVQAFLLAHANGPTDLDAVHCEGQVRVHQDAANPQDKPIDMKGDTLDLKRKSTGHELTVGGDPDRPAEVSFPDLALAGPSIKIDQIDNVAEVQGPGAMRLQSNTDFQGNKLANPSELLVTWRQEMHFNGSVANFQGHVQADQDNTRLLCHAMQVTLDRPVKFTQQPGGASGAKAAGVDKVVCVTTGEDGAAPVSVVDSLREGGIITRYQRIESRELSVFKGEGRLEAPGPGEVRILQKGPKNIQGPLAPGPAPTPAPAADAGEELKLTYVRYNHKLFVYNEKRLAIFWGNAEVLHLPADDPALHLNINDLINKLPPKALYLKCEKLEVFSEDKGPKKSHVLKAVGKATVQFDNFYGLADSITYNEEKQQVIFEGGPGRPAILSQSQGQGRAPRKLSGDKVIYNRATGRFDGTNVNSISE